MSFRDRQAAGRLLAARLAAYAHTPNTLVLALPRGGVPVGYEVARALHVPLDVFLVRKLGVPGHEELAMGALASDGTRVLNPGVLHMLDISDDVIEAVALRERDELARRERAYRDDRPPPNVTGRTIILVDDGLATGATMRAAVAALRQRHPRRIVAAVPVAAPQTREELRAEVDELICLETHDPFYGVGWWYEDFAQITDAQVHDLLARAEAERASDHYTRPAAREEEHMERVEQTPDAPSGGARELAVKIPAGHVLLEGDLAIPAGARGIVLFAHGSGSSRHSPRNRAVAQTLREGGLATLLFDLLTPEEETEDMRTARLRFDIALLAGRLAHAAEWVALGQDTNQLHIGYFGASTGGGAALVAAAEHPELAGAVVSRGGRPDLAGDALRRVQAPTLLIVGGNDTQVIELNRQALDQMRCEKYLEIVPGATHLFEEPGALEEVARLARDWFQRHLAVAPDHPTFFSTGKEALGEP